ncbi:hypothetical protein RGQ29_025800 [Quercus rubra]|uniref:AB hydrolase-1 domain-containing protein n=1 Tax=Quercus rubra TaxID=3512 RepID=A0AAN7EYU5_QUERU|nr:hypothetical protein RGQ29_025800 [Quercus rubra]
MARVLSPRNKPGFHNLLTRFLNSPSLPHRHGVTKSLETLAYEEVQASTTGKPYNSTAFVLHGLLGSARNWRSFSRTLASALSNSNSSPLEWRQVLVDLRNHGRSAEIETLEPPHDMVNAANDLANLVKARGWAWPEVVIGHSMGGKVALQFAESCARGDYGDSVSLPKQNSCGYWIPSPERWLVNHMIELGFSKSLSEWIGSNLKKSGEHETWAFNLEGAVQMFNSYREKSYWPLLEHPPKGMEIAIVRAENSDRWDSDVIQRLESLATRVGDGSEGKFSVHVLPNSGHWVHVDNPKGLLEMIAPKLASLKPHST